MRDKLYKTRERAHHLLSSGQSDIPEEATYTDVEQVIYLTEFSKHMLESKTGNISMKRHIGKFL